MCDWEIEDDEIVPPKELKWDDIVFAGPACAVRVQVVLGNKVVEHWVVARPEEVVPGHEHRIVSSALTYLNRRCFQSIAPGHCDEQGCRLEHLGVPHAHRKI